MTRYALAVDIGGTFTDFALRDARGGVIHTAKVLTTPREPERAISQGMQFLSRSAGFDVEQTELFVHATTLITNSVIERTGHDFIALHTRGFRDVPEIGREHRYNLTDLKLDFPIPTSRRDLRIAVDERVDAQGQIVVTPVEEQVMAAVGELVDAASVQNFAICFLHSFRNPRNEEVVAEWIAKAYPQATLSLSSKVAPGEREYERWSTCHINAYTRPLIHDYTRRLQEGLARQGFAGRALMMTSSGASMSFNECASYPVRLIESGPAAGVLAVKEIAARNSGVGDKAPDVLAFDMGGTTAKGAFLTGNAIHVQGELEVARTSAFEPGSGFPLLVPAVDLIEIGAGGGSIATVDELGVIAVGPRSAGAEPGPACYDNGGACATLTDANMVLGLLDETTFRHSGIQVRADLARTAIADAVATPLGISVERAALGIHATVNENVARAFRVHAAERGLDYRRYTLVCTGGSAPLHAAEVARILNIRKVLLPFSAGVSSALGLFSGTEGITLQETNVTPVLRMTGEHVGSRTDALIRREPYARALRERGAQARLSLDMRYTGQGHSLPVEIGEPSRCTPELIKRFFEEAYSMVFGMIFPGYAIEVCNWKLELLLGNGLAQAGRYRYAAARPAEESRRGLRSVVVDRAGSAEEMPVHDRYALGSGDIIDGGALIEENDATIYLPACVRATVLPSLDIMLDLGDEARSG